MKASVLSKKKNLSIPLQNKFRAPAGNLQVYLSSIIFLRGVLNPLFFAQQ